MPYPRFIATSVDEDTAVIEGEEFHHTKVKRIREGYKIELNDLKGNIYLAVVEKIEKKKLIAKILEKIPVEESPLKINLFLCIPNKLSKIDDLIEPLSELGLYSLTLVHCKTSALKEKDVLKKLSKWEKIALNSIKQCERLYPLKINPPVKLKDIPLSERNFFFYEREREKSLKEFIGDKATSINVVIGNEGGFCDEEVKLLDEKGFERLSLGKNIMKMETAVLSAVCQVSFVYDF